MHERGQVIQRLLDGELDRDQQRSAEALLAADPVLAADKAKLELLAEDYAACFCSTDREERVGAVMAALPERVPQRRPVVRTADVLVAATLLMTIWVVYGLLAEMPGLVPLSLVTGISLVVGAALLLLAEPLRQVEATVIARVLRKPLPTRGADVMVMRLCGLAIIVGAIWYKAHVAWG